MENQWDHFYDVVFDSIGKKCNEDELKIIYNLLPHHIKSICEEWGMGDTVFRDNAYQFLKENKGLTSK